MTPASQNHIDHDHIWHPYSAMHSPLPVYQVESAHGVYLQLADGRQLIDGMSSWWSVIHGYNHPLIDNAITQQLDKMSHVMFGGLTHQPAIQLTSLLLDITPPGLEKIFYSDSGSVAVEVAMKMALQYWHARQEPQRTKFIALRHGYHGDTFAAMSVCDPDTGMHSLFKGTLPEQLFLPQPLARFGEACTPQDLASLETLFAEHHSQTAAIILEPVVQGAGGMWFYSADYLEKVRSLCDRYEILLIADEIATGFGRTGKLFACEHANISPDIMCIGKALTGGYMSLAATLTSDDIARVIDAGEPGVFMHGPTFMANPLACSAAFASTSLLLESDWQGNIQRIETALKNNLAICSNFATVADVRVLGAIGVVEMKQPVDMSSITNAFVDAGIWVRPFGKLVYLMPPFIISNDEINHLTTQFVNVIKNL